jgi:hypothetical protein
MDYPLQRKLLFLSLLEPISLTEKSYSFYGTSARIPFWRLLTYSLTHWGHLGFGNIQIFIYSIMTFRFWNLHEAGIWVGKLFTYSLITLDI